MITTRHRQTIFDVAIETYGRAEAAIEIYLANTNIFQNRPTPTGLELPGILPMTLGDSEEAIIDRFPSAPFNGGSELTAPTAPQNVDTRVVDYIARRTPGIATAFIGQDVLLPLRFEIDRVVNETKQGGDGAIYTTAVGGTKPYSYIWKVSGDNNIIATTPNLIGVQAGSYEVTIWDAGGQTLTIAAIILNVGDESTYIVDEIGDFVSDEGGNPVIANDTGGSDPDDDELSPLNVGL